MPLMIKLLSASGAVAIAGAALASPATAGELYLNPEANFGVGLDSGVGGGIVEGHIGYGFDNGAYVQAGPALVTPVGDEAEIELSGKAGMSSGPLYGEVSFITGDELSLGFKVGARYAF